MSERIQVKRREQPIQKASLAGELGVVIRRGNSPRQTISRVHKCSVARRGRVRAGGSWEVSRSHACDEMRCIRDSRERSAERAVVSLGQRVSHGESIWSMLRARQVHCRAQIAMCGTVRGKGETKMDQVDSLQRNSSCWRSGPPEPDPLGVEFRAEVPERRAHAAYDQRLSVQNVPLGIRVAYVEEAQPSGSSCDDIHSRAHLPVPLFVERSSGINQMT